MERTAHTVALASPVQVRELKELLAVVQLPEGTTEKWLAKAGAEMWEDCAAETIEKCLEFVKNRIPGSNRAAAVEMAGAK
jgi:hypothetical protein